MLIDWGLLCTNQTGNVIMQFNAILHELTLFDLLVFFSRVVDAAVGRIFKICGQVYWKHVTFHNTFEPLIFFSLTSFARQTMTIQFDVLLHDAVFIFSHNKNR